MISVIMPAYNEELNIENAIIDIENQDYQDYQLIIVNDGSTDFTDKIIKKKAALNNKIIYLNPGKIGKVAAYNLASKYVKGEWIYFMGADDRLPKDAFSKWINVAKKYNPQSLVALRGKMKVISENPHYDGLILPKNKNTTNYSGPLTLLSYGMQRFILPIPEEYPNEDTWWSLCIKYFAEKEVFVDDIIVNYRIHQGNSISRDSSFETFSNKYHIRYIIRRDFLVRFKNNLTTKQKEEIIDDLKFEDMRFNNRKFDILVQKNRPVIEKARFFMLSGPVTYKIKKKFDKYFLGH